MTFSFDATLPGRDKISPVERILKVNVVSQKLIDRSKMKNHAQPRQRFAQTDRNDTPTKTTLPTPALVSKWQRFLLPTSSPLRRTLLFVAVYLTMISIFILLSHPKSISASRTVQLVLACERGRKYCGKTQHGIERLWFDHNDAVTPFSCPDKGARLPRDTFVFCDPYLSLPHSFAAFIYAQVLSVCFWACLWYYLDLTVLHVKDPYGKSFPIEATQTPWKEHRIATTSHWQNSLNKYYVSCSTRRQSKETKFIYRICNSIKVVFTTLAYGICATSAAYWLWKCRHSTLMVTLVLLNSRILIGLGNDPNLIPKIIYSCSHWKEITRCLGAGKDSPASRESLPLTVTPSSPDCQWQCQCCMLIACHLSASDGFETSQLRRTIQSALWHFPPHQIVVCDNASTLSPPDETENVVKEINPFINYFFIPVGNKSLAFYWAEKYWLPHLVRHGILTKDACQYILTVDDDVRLPRNFTIPVAQLNREASIAAVQYPITTSDPEEHYLTGKPLLIGLQDMEYVAINQIPESHVPPPGHILDPKMLSWSVPLYCSGAISVWRRKDFRFVMSQHDTVFHGEDLQMGFIVMSQSEERRIVACNDRGVVIPTTAPSTMSSFLCQRVKSWDLIAYQWGPIFFLKGFLASIYRACRGNRVAMKVMFWFLVKAMRTAIGFGPIHVSGMLFSAVLFGDIFVTDGRGLAILCAVLFLSYLYPLIHYGHSVQYLGTWRLPSKVELLVWPLFVNEVSSRLTCFLGVIYYLTAYGHEETPPSIAARESLGDIPPCPTEELHPHWDSIWKLRPDGRKSSMIV